MVSDDKTNTKLGLSTTEKISIKNYHYSSLTKSGSVFFLLIQFQNKIKSWQQQALHYTNTLFAHRETQWCCTCDDGGIRILLQTRKPTRWNDQSRPCCQQTSVKSGLDQKEKVREISELWTLTPHSRKSAQKRIAKLLEPLRKSGKS